MIPKEVYAVKIFFINPIQIINVIIDTLINLEYESYVIIDDERDFLLELLPKYEKSIIFFTILNKTEVDAWINYSNELLKIDNTQILIGAFAYDSIDQKVSEKFLENNISVIRFEDIQKNPLQVMKQIMTVFEAKGKRAYIRSKTYGQAEVYIYQKNKDKPIVCKILDMSAYAISLDVPSEYKYDFTVGGYFQEAVLILKGVRIRCSLKVVGFSSANSSLYILKICHAEIVSNKVVFTDNIPKDTSRKLHDYIKKCLKDEMSLCLREIQLEKNPALKKKMEQERVREEARTMKKSGSTKKPDEKPEDKIEEKPEGKPEGLDSVEKTNEATKEEVKDASIAGTNETETTPVTPAANP